MDYYKKSYDPSYVSILLAFRSQVGKYEETFTGT